MNLNDFKNFRRAIIYDLNLGIEVEVREVHGELHAEQHGKKVLMFMSQSLLKIKKTELWLVVLLEFTGSYEKTTNKHRA